MKEKKLAEKIAEIARKPSTDSYKLARAERKKIEARFATKK